MADMEQVLQRVLERTREGKIRWMDAREKQAFIALIPDPVTGRFHLVVKKPYLLQVLDVDGVLIDHLSTSQPTVSVVGQRQIAELYEEVRYIVMKVTEVLNQVMADLDNLSEEEEGEEIDVTPKG